MTTDRIHRGSTDVPIDAKVAFLSRAKNYPEKPLRVDPIETHMSWVFLSDAYVYKLKKPVRHEFLDFSTTDLRHRNCEREVALNRRLAPNVYLGTVTMTVDRSGRLELGGEGLPVDWLVKMRRLPAERSLDRAIGRGEASGAALQAAASLLANFYRSSPPQPMESTEYRRRFRDKVRSNHAELSRSHFALPKSRIDSIADLQNRFLDHNAALLDDRAAQNHIIEAHGDLRPEHIFLGPPPVIIDCLEFNRDFRILDPVDELAFLAMECERLGAAEVGQLFFATYARTVNDNPPLPLVNFYKSCWACFRCRVALWHIVDTTVRDTARWVSAAHEYLGIAEHYLRKL